MLNRLAVLGHPVAHSRSPAMQNAALEQLGLAREWSYEAIDVEPAAFVARVAAMPGEGFVGANVTVPHKREALVLADRASDRSKEIGAANTLSFEDGGVAADNTDAPGFLAALPGPLGGARALVLGAGGAARAIVWALDREQAEVEIWNRTAERATALAAEFGVAAVGGDEARAGVHELIVNTTTVGIDGGGLDQLPIDPEALGAGRIVVDLVYGAAETELIAAAREGGATAIDGLEMLVQQGAESLRIWTGRESPLEVMRAAARKG